MLPSTIWLIALVVLVVGEGITVGLTFIWFAVGALGGLIAAVLALCRPLSADQPYGYQRRPGHREDGGGYRGH